MLRPDIYDIAGYAHGLGLTVVMAPCGPLLNDESVGEDPPRGNPPHFAFARRGIRGVAR